MCKDKTIVSSRFKKSQRTHTSLDLFYWEEASTWPAFDGGIAIIRQRKTNRVFTIFTIKLQMSFKKPVV